MFPNVLYHLKSGPGEGDRTGTSITLLKEAQ